ncbi:MAG: hypothetical protein JNG89_19110 [Planctomycetaceae bacterium]|nr:hypothetical protein [Planctomycetaceae bacterium]
MNCDQAFDCLTDSARRHSPELAEHLARCRRCREMEATLEPALDLFDELVPEPEMGGVATARIAAPDTVRVAEQSASRLLSSGARPPFRRTLVLRYAAAAMVGAALMGVMGSINNAHSPASASKCTWRNRVIDRAEYPTNIQFARACLDCHQRGETPLDEGAQPSSTETPAELTAAVDNLMRELWNRRTGSWDRAIVIVPQVQPQSLRNLLCTAEIAKPFGPSIV